MMDIQGTRKKKGARYQERIRADKINMEFVSDFPLSTFQKRALEVIYFMRAVTMQQIIKITGYSYRYVARELLELHLNRFVERKFPPMLKYEKGSKESYFLLDEAGAIYISAALDIPKKELKWEKRDNLIKYEALRHTFEVTEFRARLEIAFRSNPDYKIIECISDRLLNIDFEHDDQRYRFRPDMLLVIRKGNREYFYFLEMDLGTEAVCGYSNKTASFDSKVEYYLKYRRSGKYRELVPVYPGILVVTTDKKRAEQLIDAVNKKQEDVSNKIKFLFTFMAALEDPLNTIDRIYKNLNGKVITLLEE